MDVQVHHGLPSRGAIVDANVEAIGVLLLHEQGPDLGNRGCGRVPEYLQQLSKVDT